MADNVILPGSGEPVATDEIGTAPNNAHYQRYKLSDGLADSTVHARRAPAQRGLMRPA